MSTQVQIRKTRNTNKTTTLDLRTPSGKITLPY